MAHLWLDRTSRRDLRKAWNPFVTAVFDHACAHTSAHTSALCSELCELLASGLQAVCMYACQPVCLHNKNKTLQEFGFSFGLLFETLDWKHVNQIWRKLVVFSPHTHASWVCTKKAHLVSKHFCTKCQIHVFVCTLYVDQRVTEGFSFIVL